MTRWIVPHSQIAVASTPVRVASRSALARRSSPLSGLHRTMVPRSHAGFSPQAARIDELEGAVRRLQRIEVVDVAVYEHGASIVVGAAATVHAFERVVDGFLRARPSRFLPQPRQQVGILACLVGTGGQVDVGADRAPQPGRDVAQHVVPSSRVGHDVVQGGPESLEQERVAVEVVAKQARTAIAVGEAQSGGLVAELPPCARNTDLENGRCPFCERGCDDERGMATAQRGADG